MKKRMLAATLLGLGLLGCGEDKDQDKSIALDKIPASVMDVAKKELPGVQFEEAWSGEQGGKTFYEVRGRNDVGKTREVKISASGEVLEKE